jgi:predicted DNA-binding transcriptional regulator YafY
MANTSSRALRLLSLLQNHRYWAGTELAERLGVSPRTVRRDVDRLRELGYPVEAHRGVDGGYQLAAGAALPPLVVDDEEAVAIAVGLQLAAQGAVAEASARALAKVTQVMPSRLRRRIQAVAAMTELATWDATEALVAADVLAAVAVASRDAERVRFGYTAADGQRTNRHVEPHRLVALDRRWYLVAYDLDRLDWRTFRLDRVGGPVTATGARFRPREIPCGDAAEFVRRNITTGSISIPARYEMVAIVEADAGDVRERIGRWAVVTQHGAGRCRVVMMAVADSDWPLIALAMTRADFEVISPPGVVARLSDWSVRFSRAASLSSCDVTG